jgi:putative MATE family efflux protein
MNISDFKDKHFYKTMLSLAIPIALQNLISSSLNMVDTVMIGGLGEQQIAAVGLANQIFFLLALVLFGINSGSAIFTAQFWGKRDILNIRKVLGISLSSGVLASLIFSAGALFIPEFILSIFTEDKTVIDLGSKYLKIISFSYGITAISYCFAFASRSVGSAKMPMLVSAFSLVVNTVLNYLLIYGNFGFPDMGIEGAAIATLIARLVELILMLYLIYRGNSVLAGTFKEMFSFDTGFAARLFKTSIPVILNEGIWSLGIVKYSIAYARIGTEAITSIQISNTIQNIFMVASMGLGNACAIMIGNRIGANENDKAIKYANMFSVIGVSLGVILGVALIAFSPLILPIFKISSQVYDTTIKILIAQSLFLCIRIYNSILIVGILRSGGDTKFSLFLELASIWLVGVPLAFIGAFVWKLPVYWVFVLVSLEEVIKAAIGIPRVVSKKWVKNVIENM